MASPSRRRSALTWLPAAILAVLIGVVVVAALAVQQSWWGQADPPASEDQQAADGSSMLSDAGLDYVNVDGQLRVRVGEGALPATALGLAADGEREATLRRPVRAVVAVGDDAFSVTGVPSFSVTTEADRIRTLTLNPATPGTWADGRGLLRDLAPTWGWDAGALAALDDDLAEFMQSGTDDTFVGALPPVPADGATIAAKLILDRASGYTAVVIEITAD